MSKQKELNNKIEKLEINEIKLWLDYLKEVNPVYNKVKSLFLTKQKKETYIQINTATPDGIYNLILVWINNNIDKFGDYDFNNIPKTDFTTLNNNNDQGGDDLDDALNKWIKYPTIDPFTKKYTKVSIMPGSNYVKLYEKFYNYLYNKYKNKNIYIQNVFETKIRNNLPTAHYYIFKDYNYIEKIKQKFPNEKWVDYLVKNKGVFYNKTEDINNINEAIVYDFLFAHFFINKNINKFSESVKNYYYYETLYLYETIIEQIKLLNNNSLNKDLDIYELFNSMVSNNITGSINYNSDLIELKLNRSQAMYKWKYKMSPLIELMVEYVKEIIYYITPLSLLRKIIYNEYFMYGKNVDIRSRFDAITDSIKYNIKRLKTIMNIIFSIAINKNAISFIENIWKKIGKVLKLNIIWITKNNLWNENDNHFHYISAFAAERISFWADNNSDSIIQDNKDIANYATEDTFKLFYISSIFDIDKLHIESKKAKDKSANKEYEPIIDKYNSELPQPPTPPKPVIISQELQKYKMTRNMLDLKNDDMETKLKDIEKKQKQYKTELKSYDKNLKIYNEKFLGKKLSPYFSVKMTRDTGDIKNSLKLMYEPLKIKKNSLETFKLKREKERSINKNLNSDLKLKLALEADKFKEYAKELTPSKKSPRQKYINCDLNDVDPLTHESFNDMHIKKLKYLSKIKTVLPNGKIITNCYDTVPIYNYILDCYYKNIKPINIAQGREPFTNSQLKVIFKNIKYFTDKKTLSNDSNTNLKENIHLHIGFVESEKSSDKYNLQFYLNIGSINFPIILDYNNYYSPKYKYFARNLPIVQYDNTLFEETSDKTVILLQELVQNGSILNYTYYPYYKYNYLTTNLETLYDYTPVVKDIINYPNSIYDFTSEYSNINSHNYSDKEYKKVLIEMTKELNTDLERYL